MTHRFSDGKPSKRVQDAADKAALRKDLDETRADVAGLKKPK